MPPRLPTRAQGPDSYLGSLKQLFSLSPPPPPHNTRPRLLRSLVTRSVAVPLSRDGRLTLPVRVRPAMIFLTFVCLIMLGFLGLSPSPNGGLPIPDKSLHFLSFFLSTLLFYFIFSLPSSTLSHTPLLRFFPPIFTGVVCLGVGGILSEFVQGALPYKIFDWGDILANLLGGGLGLALAMWGEGEWKKRRELKRLYTSVRQGGGEEDDFDQMGELLSEGSEGEEEEGGAGDWRRGGGAQARGFDLEDPWSSRDDDAGRRGGGREGRIALPTSTRDAQPSPAQQQQPPVRKGEDLFSIEDDDE
ncbi:hypothetical protein BCV69DRAFT_301802 [Microstroma glucosiphilum]|uniref:VanZ-like domain-containing protein n=1 Tax=Pseudomicrostroma glucosiphilum TaxID=1684307 RepID=A0A316TX67_9BASI|nr:hypothetical protein BCV69DRAFT_301802 [Pseudomicrostroma glucosiphilum]PWN17780.1 hypothetical protein BCV69DRAFT_301802 [Pseudomicrostroma glucosiphilum]